MGSAELKKLKKENTKANTYVVLTLWPKYYSKHLNTVMHLIFTRAL